MAYKDRLYEPKKFLEIIMFMFNKSKVIPRNCCT